MKIARQSFLQSISKGLLYFLISFSFIHTATAAETNKHTTVLIESPIVELNSNSFNAKKRSGFTIAGQSEDTGRGLTIIHFNSSKKFEHRTFDTHSNIEASEKMVEVLEKMLSSNSKFAILAHDSAAKSLIQQSGKLAELGFLKLSTLKSRQAYIMHNFKGQIFESVDDITATAKLNIPENISDNEIYFPRIRYEFEPNNNRYIAHAGGEVNGIKSTNTKDALDQNYKKGFRLFELDIIETSDGKLVAAHDWKMWARFTDYSGALPPSHAEFMKHKIYGDYTTLDLKGINAWFAAHPDATLVTDKVNDPIAFANQFVDKDRLVMELFSQMAIEEASRNGIQPMISQTPLMKLKGNKINYLQVNNVKYVALSRRIIANETKLMLQLKEAGIKVYVYNVNFDPGKDEKYVQENEIGLVYGMYADKWVFDSEEKKLSK
ncbi:hypothetical protein FEE95_12845 [Maribacter algarum]|uniref:ILEI/PANDER domain-containing protein n=1 Tax=Maribacter algarum (ex Zhang et al. 2020) TaxID=2578118 RepID=A0A5S3PRI9_9FLAO|nr:interleukin-like EMT inducer domain-containing protein [Maribacter algarum]TMM57366.1 hypothetical protein FEE95_12845 [Maribacter algarum]